MKKKLLITASILFSLEIGGVQAACTEAPSCTEMGFTKTEAECEYGSVKCPWNTGLVYCRKRRAKCQIGWIYYDDGTCSANVKSEKTALGVVVYVNPDGVGGQAMTAWTVDKYGKKSNVNYAIEWAVFKEPIADNIYDIESLPNHSKNTIAKNDFNSCDNTDKIIAETRAAYPAAQATRWYAPTEETKGKWCLPAAGVLSSLYYNFSTIEAGINKLGGLKIASYEQTWSSSEYAWNYVYTLSMKGEEGLLIIYKGSASTVRPVLEF